jgi:prophage DNA circulation protein
VRKNCSSDRKNILKFETECREFAKFLRSLEQFIQIVQGKNNFLNRMFFNLLLEVSQINALEDRNSSSKT